MYVHAVIMSGIVSNCYHCYGAVIKNITLFQCLNDVFV